MLEILKEYVEVGDRMLMVGGGSKSRLWRQIFADVYGMNISVPTIGQDAGSLGAAALAAAGAGIWKDPTEVCSHIVCGDEASPDQESVARYGSILPIYEKLLEVSSYTGDFFEKI